MRHPLSSLVPLFCLLLLTACGRGPPKLPPLTDGAVIVAFGDSLTYGTGAAPGETYPAVLAGLTARPVINAGVPGEISADGLARLPAVLDQHAPALLILTHGGNDMLRRIAPSETQANLSRMIQLARGRGIAVVLLAVPRPGLFLSGAEIYQAVADETGTPLENDVVADVLGDRALKSDAIHPNAQGYARIAEAVQRLLRDAGALR